MTDDTQVYSEISRSFYRNLVLDMPQLFEAIVRFNTSIRLETEKNRLASWKDTSLLDGILFKSNRATAQFLGGDTVSFWNFEEESRRIALLEPSILKNLILSFGAALCAPLLNRFIRKKDVETLKQDIHSNYLDFARGRGRFILGDISEIIKLKEQNIAPEKMRSLIIKYGMYAHGICSSAWPESLQNFEDSKIGHQLPDLFEHRIQLTQVNPSHLRAIWFSMKKILLKEVAPQWTPCFS